MIHLLALVVFQTGVSAGPAQASCDGSQVTLWAKPQDPPAAYSVMWDGASEPGVFRVVAPTQTTTYRVVLTDLNTSQTFEDTTRVLVHPGDPDLDGNGLYDDDDWGLFYADWAGAAPQADLDPDGDGRTSVLDWFYFCNFEQFPVNTPPMLSVMPAFTITGDSVVVPYTLEDAESNAQLHIASQPQNGFATLISGVLRYSPDIDYVGLDAFSVYAEDGIVQTPPVTVDVEVFPADTYTDLVNDIFAFECAACHLDGVVSGGLSLSTYASAQTGGNSGPAFVAGAPESSPLYLRVADGSMPRDRPPLPLSDVERIRLWILRGAAP